MKGMLKTFEYLNPKARVVMKYLHEQAVQLRMSSYSFGLESADQGVEILDCHFNSNSVNAASHSSIP